MYLFYSLLFIILYLIYSVSVEIYIIHIYIDEYYLDNLKNIIKLKLYHLFSRSFHLYFTCKHEKRKPLYRCHKLICCENKFIF